MTAFETTRRDLALIRGWVMVPTTYGRIGERDTILSPQDGTVWHVRRVERLAHVSIISVVSGRLEGVLEKSHDDPVHVLEDSTGVRLTEHLGAPVVRARKGQS